MNEKSNKSWEMLIDIGFGGAQCEAWAEATAHLEVAQQNAIASRIYGLGLAAEALAQAEVEFNKRFNSTMPGAIVRNVEAMRYALDRMADVIARFRSERDALVAVLRFAGVKFSVSAPFGGLIAEYISAV